MNDDDTTTEEEPLFTCKECGGHELRIVYEYDLTRYYDKTLDCQCGNADDEVAAVRSYHVTTRCQDQGWLNDEHRVDWEEKREELEKIEEEEDEHQVFCEQCMRRARRTDRWETTQDVDKTEVDEGSKEWYIYCDNCNREIEFGWSHPDRGGRIWPAECTDFNSWKCWPEPRYVDEWARKNWLRPRGRRQR